MSHNHISLIPRAKLFGNPTRAQCKISPDGRYLSWLAPRDDVLNIWVAPVDDLAAARPLTNDRHRGIRFASWARDGVHMLYVQDEGGDEDWHIYAVRADGGEARDLTPVKGVHAQIGALSWSRPDRIMVGLNDRDARWHDTYEIDIASGERKLVLLNDCEFGGINFDNELRPRLAFRRTAEEGAREFFRRDGDDWTHLFSIGHEDDLATGIAGFDGTGEAVYMIDTRGRDKAALTLMDVATGATTLLAEDDRADISDLMLHPTTYALEAYAVNHEKTEWFPIDERIARDHEILTDALTGEIDVASRTKANDRWVVTASAAERPATYYYYNRETQELRELFASRPELAGEPLAPMHPVVIPARDKLPLVSYLTLPRCSAPQGAARPEEPRPLVLLVHGGPWARDAYGFNPVHQWLADRGYAVLSVNYRGSIGFGKSFINAADREWAGKMHDDLIDAVEWAVAEGIARTDEIAIMGGSYGGYATLVGLTFTPDRFACGVDIVGPSNLETLLATIPPYWTSFFETFARRVGDPRTEDGLALLRARSPLHKADRIERPLLIGQGANDPRVKQAEADQIVTAMTGKGLPVTYALYPDEGHGFARPENRLSFYALAETFLAEHLGGAAERIGDDLRGASLEVPEGASHLPGLEEAMKRTA